VIQSCDALEFVFLRRSYQAELIKHFNSPSCDHHFPVIAPSGCGKTILGIEILRQLGNKTLVLALTLTIRNQWDDLYTLYY
jgi:superfamily II DNA or RNA helicase